MEQPAIFSATLGLSHPWQITSVSFSKDEKRLDITVAFAHNGNLACPTCGAEGSSQEAMSETWYHNDFFRYATYLHARVPRSECTCCGIFTVTRPWSREGSRFSLIATE